MKRRHGFDRFCGFGQLSFGFEVPVGVFSVRQAVLVRADIHFAAGQLKFGVAGSLFGVDHFYFLFGRVGTGCPDVNGYHAVGGTGYFQQVGVGAVRLQDDDGGTVRNQVGYRYSVGGKRSRPAQIQPAAGLQPQVVDGGIAGKMQNRAFGNGVLAAEKVVGINQSCSRRLCKVSDKQAVVGILIENKSVGAVFVD